MKKGQCAPARLVGWLVWRFSKKVPKNRGFFCRQEFRISIRLNHAGVTGADCRHINDFLLLLEIPVQAVEDTLY